MLVPTSLPAQVQEQTLASAGRRPRFWLTSRNTEPPIAVDAQQVPLLRQRITVNLDNVSLKEALAEISRQARLPLMYSQDNLPADARIRFRAEHITIAGALSEVLIDTDLDILLSADNRVALVKRTVASWKSDVGGSVVGQMKDSSTGRGIRGVEVFLNGTRWRTTTDTSGWFRLVEVDPGTYTLTARRLGYRKRSRQVTVSAGQEDTVAMALTASAARLDELVTTATGRRRRIDIANDITTIHADSVMQVAPIRSLTDLLENRVPGLTVQRTSGAPGDPARLRLRGASSPLRSNDPIVYINGVRVYAEQSAIRNGNLAAKELGGSFYSSATPSPIDFIDPNTIETIEVLKGPSAATMYGQDAANGVIVITTKTGRPGPTRWTGNVTYGRTQIEGDYPELLYRWGHSVLDNTQGNCSAVGMLGSVPCAGDSVLSFQLLNDPALTVLNRGHRTAGSIGVTGGTQALTYSVIGSYANELGLIKLPQYEADRYQEFLGVAPPDWMVRPQNFQQWGVASTVTARLGTKADVSLDARLSRSEQQKSSIQDQLSTLMSAYLDRSSGLYYYTGPSHGTTVTQTPIANYYQRATAAATTFTNGVRLTYEPLQWLRVTGNAGLNIIQRTDRLFAPRGPVNTYAGFLDDTTGQANDGQGNSVESTVDLRANALKSIGQGFQLSFAAGVNYAGTSTNDVSGGSRNLPPGSSLQGSEITFLRRDQQSDATFGWYLEPSIGNRRFNFTSGLRLDGGSRFGYNVGGLNLPKFPKLGFTYLISDESWFPFKALVQSMRVRVSYGRASRQPGPTDRLRLYDIPQEVFADSQFHAGVALLTLGNTAIRPERSSEFEGGFDIDMFDSRFSVTVSGYQKTTDDAILGVPVAPSVYGDDVSFFKNIGVTRNTGLEMDVGASLVRSPTLTWVTHLGLSRRRDMLVSLGTGVEPFYTSGNGFNGGTRVAPGYPLFGRWSKPILGYSDANSNGVLELSEVQLGDTAVYVGSTIPNYNLAFSSTLSLWHGAVTFDASFSYEDGLAQQNAVALSLGVFSAGQQVPGTALADQASTIDLTAGPFGQQTDYNWIQTVSTTRFNSLAVRYNVPAMVTRRLGAQQLSVSLIGGNLGLWTNYRGLDPNVNAFGTGNNVTDTGVLPQPRTWQLQVNATY